jgi:hypothetical protein
MLWSTYDAVPARVIRRHGVIVADNSLTSSPVRPRYSDADLPTPLSLVAAWSRLRSVAKLPD